MKTDRITGHIGPTRIAGHGTTANDNTFGQILDRTINTVQSEERSESMSCQVSEVNALSSCEASRMGGRTLQHASKMLNLLEEYAQALNDPNKTLKLIEPLVDQIQQRVKDLSAQCPHDAGPDDELATLVNKIAVTASVEAFKFQRGDYIT
jgi:hypothetical protein